MGQDQSAAREKGGKRSDKKKKKGSSRREKMIIGERRGATVVGSEPLPAAAEKKPEPLPATTSVVSSREEDEEEKMSLAENWIEDKNIRLIRTKGSGTYGEVWEAECSSQLVAVKIIHNNAAVDELEEAKKKELMKEILHMTVAKNPYIILLMGITRIQERFALVMELMDGDLQGLLISKNGQPSSGSRMSLFQRMCMARDAAKGMSWLHNNEPAIIHRDLKLENLMYKKLGPSAYQVKIADFGLCAIKPKNQSKVLSNVKGTPLTMAPELMMDLPFDQKADVYSFGCMLWQFLTCTELYKHHVESSDYETFARAICEQRERPKIPSGTLPLLQAVLEGCWSPFPSHRPDFKEINNDLDQIIIEAAISDEGGRDFWFYYFKTDYLVEWDTFKVPFFRYLNIPLPEDQNTDEAPSEEVMRLRCAKELLATRPESGRLFVDIENFGKVIAWFGGMHSREGETSDIRREVSLLEHMRLALSSTWFFGKFDSDDSAKVLANKKPGTFLVRYSSTEEGCFTISLLTPQAVISTRVTQSSKGYTISTAGYTRMWPTLRALIDDLISAQNLTPCTDGPFLHLFQGRSVKGMYGNIPI